MSLYHELKRRNVIRVAIAYLALAWLVTEVAGTVFPAFGIPDWGVRFFVIAFALGFVPALIISWVYEITPEGLKREKEVVRDASITHLTAKRLDVFTIGVVVVALAFILADRLWLSPRYEQQITAPAEVVTGTVQTPGLEPAESQYPPKSIAVLPFADMSESQDQGWFADGLAEEILNTLVRTPDLLVSSRTSSFKFRNTELDAPGIARELGVAHVLEGSVRRAGDRVRVTAQLIRAVDGFHVWSEHFDRSVEDVISIQEDLAINIAKALKTTMDPVALKKMLQAGTRSVEAYEHYLNGLALINRGEISDYSLTVDALEHFEMARTLDSGFAAAHAQSALIWRAQYSADFAFGLIDVSFHQASINFRERMSAAVENAPDETQRMLYEAELAIDELRGAEAVRLLRRVLEKLPNNIDATEALRMAAAYSGDTEAYILAVDNFHRLGDITAISRYINALRNLVPSDHYVAGVLEQVKRFPNSSTVIYQAHRALLWAGEFEKAHKLYPHLISKTGRTRYYVDVRQACSLGDREEAQRILRTVEQESADNLLLLHWYILVLLGEYEAAAQVLKPYESEQVPYTLGSLLVYQQFDPRPFPTLMAILEREGLDWPPPREIPFACPPKVEE